MHEEIVRQVLALAQDSVAEPLRARLEGYIRAYVRAIPAEVLSEVEPKVLLAFLGERFASLEEDFGRTVKVTIRDPQTTLADDQHSTVIETRLPDCAFVIRTIKAFLREQGLQLLFVLHPIHGVVAVDGKVTSVDAAAPSKYSQVYLQVTAIPPERREALRLDLERRLERTLLVNRDRFPMMARIDEVRAYCCNIAGLDASKPSPRESQQIPPRLVQRLRAGAAETPREREAGEVVELVDWFKDDNIILIGYAFFPASGPAAPQRGLGLFASDDHAVLDEVIGEIVATRRTREELYSFYHTDYRTVVRSVTQVQYFGIAEPGPDGRSIGEHVFVGLMSTKSAKQANRRIPVVGARVRQLMSTLEDAPGSYAYQKMAAILDSIPLEDLFYWTTDEVRTIAREFRLAESKDHPRVFVWRRPTGRRISVVCVVPRMQFSEALRAELSGEIRTFLQVPHLREYRQETDDESPIRLHFTVGKYRPNVSEADLEQLVDGLEHLLQSWTDQLRDLVFRRYRGDSTAGGYQATTAAAQDIWSRYGARFPQSYQDALPPEIALLDLGLIEQLSAARPVRVVLVRMGEGAGRYTSLRIVSRKELVLNDVVPSLHRMALRTTSRFAEKLEGPGPEVFVTSFEVSGADGKHIESEAALERLGQIVQRVLDGQLLDDRLLGLGYLAALDWQQIDLLITYRNYFVQVFQGFGAHSVNDALLKHPACAGLLVEYFETKFRTDRPESPQVRTEQLLPPIARRYDELLEDVTSIQEDLILRYFVDLFEATRRTNFYRPGRGDTISIKVESALIEHMPRPCPLYEVYVHAPGVEGIHLRGGKVARGGLRHSDRADDFRTEVLGLQRTQTLKNTVIVPTGSKGGFVTRKLGANREEARAQYEVFIAGLLDVTDNYQGTAIVPPPGVLRYDEDDPYLVVAADKGTAHLSDTANGISLRYGFWLDDAFASGGSAGYDHKAIGITSRGGWVNVERHFREMGTDIRQHSIRVAGVGDMSGDVFGNGMLLNDKMKVVAAFNHKHVFLDPEPDPATSYAERKRMFNTPGTQWTDYATSALSKGGGIYERAAKEIELSAEAQALLGLPAVVTGPDIVRAILQLDVDLMWFGGIGTYVKASSESHGEVGDKVNDNVRINASELRAKVLGEGANLAMTQRARTEYGQRGGRCNTDAIDNSAGVDCSDHEVNLKILFAPMMSTGQMTREARDKLLRELENDVATAVVQDNYLQSALLSMESTRTQQQGAPFLDLLQYLDKRHLNRAAEHVPPDEELRSWLATGKGLPRNLLAVLVAHTKLDLYDKVLASRIPDLALFKPMLFSYFPPRLAASHATWIERHHLRREIVATQATNAIINQAGSTLLVSLCKETVLPVDELVIRYFVCDELIGGRALRAAIHACDYQIPAAAQYEALLMIEDVLRVLLRWWIWNDRAWKVSSDDVDTLRPAFAAAGESLLASLDPAGRAALAAREQALLVKGFAPALAGQLARIGVLGQAFAVLHSARVHGLPLAEVAGMYQRVGRDLHLDTFDELLGAQVPANSWERRFLASIERESAAIRQLGVTKLASEVGYVERHRDRITAIADSLRMVRQFGGHGLVPMYLILEDYRVPW